jgi:hypothetical protein
MVTYTFVNGNFADADEVNQNFDDVEYDMKRVPIVQVVADYTITEDDLGKMIEVNSSSAVNITIPLNLTTMIGASVEVFRLGTGTVTIVPASGVTLKSRLNFTRLAFQHSGATLTRSQFTNTWYLNGDLV